MMEFISDALLSKSLRKSQMEVAIMKFLVEIFDSMPIKFVAIGYFFVMRDVINLSN